MSFYEKFNPLTTVAKQRFVETFSGDALDTDRWYETITGSGSTVMSDAVDGGAISTTSTGASDRCTMEFNNIRQYDSQASVFIAVAKIQQTTTTEFLLGLWDNTPLAASDALLVDYNSGSSANWRMNRSFTTITDTTIAVDTNYHCFKLTAGASSVAIKVDGVESTSGTAVNADKLQPALHIHNLAASAHSSNISYMEAYNT
jgi:hypothetical protein